MSDHVKGFAVTLEADINSERAAAIVAAIEQIRGVIRVMPVAARYEDIMNEERARWQIRERLWKALEERTS